MKSFLTKFKKYVILSAAIGTAVFVCPKQAMSRTWNTINRISYCRPKVAFFTGTQMNRDKYRDKLGRFRKGYTQPKELIEKRTEAQRGIPCSQETKEKIRKSLVGKKHTKKRKDNISKSMKGKTRTIEQRMRMSKAHKGPKSHFWKGGADVF